MDFELRGKVAGRIARINKFRGWVPRVERSYIAKDLAGPGTYEAWECSFNVFVTAMIMFGHWTCAGAGDDRNRVRQLNSEWPDCWGLVSPADC